jgi:hypothetical protein
MRVNFLRGLACAGALGAMVALGACQGNIGGGSGLSIPQAPGFGQPAGPSNGAPSQSRERVLDGAVYLGSKLTEVPLPTLAGFSIAIELGTPGPSASPTGVPAATQLGSPAAKLAGGIRSVSPLAPPAASVTPSASAPGSPAAAAASASPPGSPAPATSPSPTKGSSAAPGPTPGPRIATKTTIYPDDAPSAPTPIPTGEVQTFVHRTAIVRGYLQPETDLSLYGLGAIRFTIPSTELLPRRGFTIAVYESGKHRHDHLIAYDTDPAVGNSFIASDESDPLVLKKGIGYLLLLYGDDTAPTPAPAQVAPGYPSPGNNPFPTPTGSAYPPGVYGGPTPYSPYPTATPFTSPFGTPHP